MVKVVKILHKLTLTCLKMHMLTQISSLKDLTDGLIVIDKALIQKFHISSQSLPCRLCP